MISLVMHEQHKPTITQCDFYVKVTGPEQRSCERPLRRDYNDFIHRLTSLQPKRSRGSAGGPFKAHLTILHKTGGPKGAGYPHRGKVVQSLNKISLGCQSGAIG